MPDASEWSGISEMSVAVGNPTRLSCQAFLRIWTRWKSLRTVFWRSRRCLRCQGRRDHDLGQAIDGGPVFVFPDLCWRHQPRASARHTTLYRSVYADSRLRASLPGRWTGPTRPCRHCSPLLASLSGNTRLRLLRPCSTKRPGHLPFFQTHQDPPRLDASLRLDGSHAKSSSPPRTWRETPGDAEAPPETKA